MTHCGILLEIVSVKDSTRPNLMFFATSGMKNILKQKILESQNRKRGRPKKPDLNSMKSDLIYCIFSNYTDNTKVLFDYLVELLMDVIDKTALESVNLTILDLDLDELFKPGALKFLNAMFLN